MNTNYSILRIVWEFAPTIGGSITHITELSKKIDPYLRKQIILAPYIEGCESFDKSFPVPIIRLKNPITSHTKSPIISNLFYSLSNKKRMTQIIEEYNIDIIHFHSVILAAYLIPQLRSYNKGLKFVVMCHGWPGINERQIGLSYRLGKKLIPLFPPHKYLILSDGSQINELQSLLDVKNISWEVVYHAIDTKFFKPGENSLNATYFNILFPHRPVSIKKPEIAIQIFKRFLGKIDDQNVSLTFISAEKPYKLKKIAEKEKIEKNIHFLDNQSGDSMVECINSSSVIIGTSLNSNKGRAIQESMACEKPVVVFNNNGNMSDLIEHMENGLLVESGNIDDFVDSLIELYQNPDLRRKLGLNARKTILEKRSWEKRIETELATYREIL